MNNENGRRNSNKSGLIAFFAMGVVMVTLVGSAVYGRFTEIAVSATDGERPV